MSKHLARDLAALEQNLLGMATLVEGMICDACRALRERNSELAHRVIAGDDQVDHREVLVEEDCLKILALHQPVASDLRLAATTLKVNNELERIADLAVNIAERSIRLESYPRFELPERLEQMAQVTVNMVQRAIRAFVELDEHAARSIRLEDDEVDKDNVHVISELYIAMRKHPAQIEPALHCFSASRQIERIADHATNIAEDVIYLVSGDIVRHQHDFEQHTVKKMTATNRFGGNYPN